MGNGTHSSERSVWQTGDKTFSREWFWAALVTAVSLVVGGWLVKSWTADFIVTLGDKNYPDGAAATIDHIIGQYYSRENILIDSITLTPKSSTANLQSSIANRHFRRTHD